MEHVKMQPVHLKHVWEQTTYLRLAIALSWEGNCYNAALRTRMDRLCTAIYYGICMNDGFSGCDLTCGCHPKGEGGHVAVHQNTLPGAVGSARCQTHRSSLGLACGGCDPEVTKETWWSSWWWPRALRLLWPWDNQLALRWPCPHDHGPEMTVAPR